MEEDRQFWEGIYRCLLSIASLILRHKLGGLKPKAKA